MSPALDIAHLSARRGARTVLQDVSLRVAPGECVGLIGPNGAGKTSLMRAALGLLSHDGHASLAALPARDRARHVAWLPQQREIAWPMTVERVVALGRLPYLPRGAALGHADRAAIDASLRALGLEDFAQRIATELSGGEQARVLLARALAQQTPLLMADEPTAGLDPAHQIAAMECLAGLARSGRAVVVSLHDLGLAARHCTRLVLMDQGRVVADGAPCAVLTAAHMRAVFGIDTHMQMTARGLVFQPMGVV